MSWTRKNRRFHWWFNFRFIRFQNQIRIRIVAGNTSKWQSFTRTCDQIWFTGCLQMQMKHLWGSLQGLLVIGGNRAKDQMSSLIHISFYPYPVRPPYLFLAHFSTNRFSKAILWHMQSVNCVCSDSIYMYFRYWTQAIHKIWPQLSEKVPVLKTMYLFYFLTNFKKISISLFVKECFFWLDYILFDI